MPVSDLGSSAQQDVTQALVTALRAIATSSLQNELWRDVGTVTAATSLDCSTANGFAVTLGASVTVSLQNLTGVIPSSLAPATAYLQTVQVEVTQDATGFRTPTFTGVTWVGGTPTWSTAAGAVDVVSIQAKSGVGLVGYYLGSYGATNPTGWSANVTALSPYAWYRLNETVGTTASDSSGNARDGAYIGSVTLDSMGVLTGTGTDVTLDGSTALISVDAISSLIRLGKDWSLVLPFNEANPGATTRTLLSVRSGSNTNPAFQIQNQASGDTTRIRVFWRDDAGTAFLDVAPSSSQYFDGTGHLLGLSFDSTTKLLYLYRDGSLNATITVSGYGVFGGLTVNQASVGAIRSTGTSSFFNGTVGDLAVYNYKLTTLQHGLLWSARTAT